MGRAGTIIAYLIGAVIWISIIILGFNYYENLYIEVEYKIIDIAILEQVKKFQETYKPISLFIRIADVHPLFYIAFIVLILIPVFHKFLKK